MPDINSDIQYLKGVGPAYAKKFAKLGIYTIRDLLLHYPRRYIDYSQPYTVVSAPFDVDCCVKATVLQRDPDRRIKGGRMLSHVLAGDDTGMLALSWFNAPYAAEKLEPGTEYYFEGRVGGMMTRREILHPLVRTEAQVAAAPLLPVYGSTEGLPAARLTRWRWNMWPSWMTRCRQSCCPATACRPKRTLCGPSMPRGTRQMPLPPAAV